MAENINTIREYRSVMITGVAGSVGQALLDWLVKNCSPEMHIVGVDNCETSIADLQRSYINTSNVKLFLADICDAAAMDRYCEGIDLLFHLAALKHVSIGEQSPDQLIATNLLGLQNVIGAARRNRVEQMIFTSSDKAILPSNAMGASKLIGERLMSAANETSSTRYTSVRFGNVLGSNGSVIPTFRQQLNGGGPVTITHPDMTRFTMTLSRSANQKRVSDFDIVEIGIQAGEKLHEDLMTDTEAESAYLMEDEFDGYYFVSPTETTQTKRSCKMQRPPETSADVTPMSIPAIKSALRELRS